MEREVFITNTGFYYQAFILLLHTIQLLSKTHTIQLTYSLSLRFVASYLDNWTHIASTFEQSKRQCTYTCIIVGSTCFEVK